LGESPRQGKGGKVSRTGRVHFGGKGKESKSPNREIRDSFVPKMDKGLAAEGGKEVRTLKYPGRKGKKILVPIANCGSFSKGEKKS